MPLNTFDKTHTLTPPNFLSSESSAIYVSSLLRTFGLSLIGIFLPIFLFKLKLPFLFSSDGFINSIFTICIFFFLESVFTLLFVFIFARWFYRVVPFQRILLFSNLVLIVALVCLYNLESVPMLYFIVPIFLGLVITCYWVPYHLFFIEKNSDKNGHYGKKLGIASFLSRAGDALGPLLGGFILLYFGFKALFLLSSALILVSSLPIFFEVKDVRHHIDNPIKIISKYLLNKKYSLVSTSFLGVTMIFVVYALFWPIILLISLQDFSKIGILTFFSLLVSASLALLVGRFIDKKSGNKIHAIGVVFASIFHLIRVFVSIPLHIYTLDMFSRANSAFFELPFVSKTYEIAHGGDAADFVIYREISLHIFRIFVIFLVMVMFLFLPDWKYIFVFASIGSVLSFFISLQKKVN